MFKKIKNFFQKSYDVVLAHAIWAGIGIGIISVAQILFEYGSMKIYLICVAVGLLRRIVVKLLA